MSHTPAVRPRAVRRRFRSGAAVIIPILAAALAACTGNANTSTDSVSNAGGNVSSSAGASTVGATAATDIKSGGTLKIASALSDLDALDPLVEYSIDSWEVGRAITRQLVTFQSSSKSLSDATKLVPDLAKSWDVSPDGKTYTFHLQDGIQYYDTGGKAIRAIKAKDFVYAVKRFCDPNKEVAAIAYFNLAFSGFADYCTQFGKDVKPGNEADAKKFEDTHDIPGVRATDDTTLVLKSDSKNYDFLSILTMNFVTPLPEEVVGTYIPDSQDFRNHFPSSGPYYVESDQSGKALILKKVPNYNFASDPVRKAYVDEIDIDFSYNDPNKVVQAIQSGDADLSLYLNSPPAPTIASYKAKNSPYLYSSPGGGATFVTLNIQKANTSAGAAALRKLPVRQALTYAVDRANIVKLLGGSVVAQPFNQVLIPTNLGYQLLNPYPTDGDHADPAKAKELLAQAGYPNGLTLSGVYPSGVPYEPVALEVKNDFAKAGITLNLIKIPTDQRSSYVNSAANNTAWDLNFGAGFAPDWQGDSDRMLLGGWLDSDGADCGVGNRGVCYDNPELNKLAAKAFASDSPGPIWTEADKLAAKDLPWIPLYSTNKVLITSDRVRNFQWANLPVGIDLTTVAVDS